MSFLIAKWNSFSVSSEHFNWKELLLSAAAAADDDDDGGGGEKYLSTYLRLNGTLALASAAACTEQDRPSNSQLTKKMTNIY